MRLALRRPEPWMVCFAASLVFVVVAAGCSPSESEGAVGPWTTSAVVADADDEDAVERFAFLTATVLEPRAETARSVEPVSLRAVFVSHEGQAREAVLDLLSLPQVLRLQPVDTCVLLGEDPAERAPWDAFRTDQGAGWVDLLDAGQVSAAVDGVARALEAQYFPDVVPTVSGVTYAGAADLGHAGVRSGRPYVRFDGTGSGEIGPFGVSLALPAPVTVKTVDDRRPDGGAVPVASRGDLVVRWEARGASDEPLLLELSRRSYGAADTIRCVVEDDGAYTVPSAIRARLPEHREPATDRLTVRRTAGSEFYARGVDEGWAFAIAEDFVVLEPVD